MKEFLSGLREMLNLVVHAGEAQKKLSLKADNSNWAFCFPSRLCYKNYP